MLIPIKVFPLVLNIWLRLAIFYFLAETMLFPSDPRFLGKAIPERNFVIVVGASLVFPLLYIWRRKNQAGSPTVGHGLSTYPFWSDFLYLSIFALDMAGNSFSLYDTIFWFDLIPHFHGTGAAALIFYLAVLARDLFGKIKLSKIESFLLAFGLATILHAALEAQEFYTDVFAGTHNVRGVFDVINDLVAGFLGSIVYVALFEIFARSKTKDKIKQFLTPLANLFA